MLNYITVRVLFLAALLITAGLDWKMNVPFWLYIFYIVLFLAINVWGSYFIQSGFFIRALWHGNRSKKTIAITFDDGPVEKLTVQLLDILQQHQVQAAFFLIGKNIEANERVVKQMFDEGHVIGNHSFSHTYWYSINTGISMRNDLLQCDNKIEAVIGRRPKLFRPPYGVTNPMVRKAAELGNYTCVGWSLRTYDTVARSRNELLEKCLKRLKNGDVVLFHDWGEHTLGILSDFIKGAHSRGFEIIRLDKLLDTSAYY